MGKTTEKRRMGGGRRGGGDNRGEKRGRRKKGREGGKEESKKMRRKGRRRRGAPRSREEGEEEEGEGGREGGEEGRGGGGGGREEGEGKGSRGEEKGREGGEGRRRRKGGVQRRRRGIHRRALVSLHVLVHGSLHVYGPREEQVPGAELRVDPGLLGLRGALDEGEVLGVLQDLMKALEERGFPELGLLAQGVVDDGQQHQAQVPRGGVVFPEGLPHEHLDLVRALESPSPVPQAAPRRVASHRVPVVRAALLVRQHHHPVLEARELSAVVGLEDRLHVYQGHQDVSRLEVLEQEVAAAGGSMMGRQWPGLRPGWGGGVGGGAVRWRAGGGGGHGDGSLVVGHRLVYVQP